MSKESLSASDCECGMRIQFMEQHVPHCQPAKDKTAVLSALNNGGHAAAMQAVTEIATRNAKTSSLANHGVKHDEKISKGKHRRG